MALGEIRPLNPADEHHDGFRKPDAPATGVREEEQAEDKMSGEMNVSVPKAGDTIVEEISAEDRLKLCGNVKVGYDTVIEKKDGSLEKKPGFPPSPSGYTVTETPDPESTSKSMIFTTKVIDGKRDSTTVVVNSEKLRLLMKEVMSPILEHRNSTEWDDPAPISFMTSDDDMIACWDDLQRAADDPDSSHDAEARDHLQCLLRHVERYEMKLLEAWRCAWKEGQVHFEFAHLLFRPGCEVVVAPFNQIKQIFVVNDWTAAYGDDGAELLEISCLAYEWDGQRLVRTMHTFRIRSFRGPRKAVDLECYPLVLHKDGKEGPEELRAQLAERGRVFQRLCRRSRISQGATPRLWRCDTYAYDRGQDEPTLWLGLPLPESMRSKERIVMVSGQPPVRIVIDPSLYMVHNPSSTASPFRLGDSVPKSKQLCTCHLCTDMGGREAWEERFAADDVDFTCKSQPPGGIATVPEISEERFLSQLPPRCLGYVLDQKRWAQLQVDRIEEEARDTNGTGTRGDGECRSSIVFQAWENLLLEPEHKNNIEKMVRTHLRQAELSGGNHRIRDPVPGKGEGLVLLLHGLPGLGKTMAAEALAQTTGRRLLRIDATDFDYNRPGQVSKVLKKFFQCAHHWGAILLLDEADVFLQSRKGTTLSQNALVSVLLRELEYFKGVLIMTTNRILTMDTAMESRVHYTVKFRDLDKPSMIRIFETFAEQMNDENCRPLDRSQILDYVREEASDLITKKMTGRDIRNILSTAQLLDWPYITFANFRKILRNTGNFRQDMALRAKSEHAAVAVRDDHE